MKRIRCAFVAIAWIAIFVPSPAHGQGLGDLANKLKPQKKEQAGKKDSMAIDLKLPPWTGPKKRLGIMDMEVKVTGTTAVNPTPSGGVVSTTTVSVPMPTDFGTGLTEILTTALVDTKRFILLERKNLADIQAEHALAQGGAVSADSAPAAGALLGAQALIRGAVTEYSYRVSQTGTSGILRDVAGLSHSTGDAMVALDIRIYDTSTGAILDSVRAEGRAKSSATSVQLKVADLDLGGSAFASSPLGKATREAIEKAVRFICERMEKRPWEGRIAEIEEGDDGSGLTLYLNAGSRAGIKPGDVFEILRPGRPIVNPETKVVIGRTRDKPLGKCRVETVDDEVCTALVLSGAGFEKADIVRYLDPNRPASDQKPGPSPDGEPKSGPATSPNTPERP